MYCFGEVSDTSFTNEIRNVNIYNGINRTNYINIPLRFLYKLPLNQWFVKAGLGSDLQIFRQFSGHVINASLDGLALGKNTSDTKG